MKVSVDRPGVYSTSILLAGIEIQFLGRERQPAGFVSSMTPASVGKCVPKSAAEPGMAVAISAIGLIIRRIIANNPRSSWCKDGSQIPSRFLRSACQISRTEIGEALLILGTLTPRRTFADQADSIPSKGEGFRTGRESTEAIPLFDVQPRNQLHQLRHRPGAHLFHHVGAVVLDRLRADGEVPGDCLIRVTSDDQVQYLAFA